jgi:predicted DNA-binding ribbon-helix-helix protein
MQPGAVKKRSILVGGHKTSVSLEDPFWRALQEIAGAEGVSVSHVISRIGKSRAQFNLSSAIRLFVLDHYRSQRQAVAESRAAA